MTRSLVQIYALAVCFFCAAGMAVTLNFILYGTVQFAVPALTMFGYEDERQADAKALLQTQITRVPESIRQEFAEMGPEQLEAERRLSLERHIAAESRDGHQTILQCGIIFAVLACVFFLHLRLSWHLKEAAD